MVDEVKNAWESNKDFNEYYDERNSQKDVAEANCHHLSPSEVLFSLDVAAYDEAVGEFKNTKKEEAFGKGFILEEVFKENLRRFEDVYKIIHRGRIVPFVGAGLSKACGYPTWQEYLELLAKKAKNHLPIEEAIKLQNLDDVADILLNDLGESHFNEASDSIFGKSPTIEGPIKYIPQISSSCVVTTNFDCVVESAFYNANKPFSGQTIGNQPSDFHRDLAIGERHLLKIHGRSNDKNSRVFCKKEYQLAYETEDGNFDFKKPLPNILSRLYRNYCILFVGCGLHNDKTMSLFKAVIDDDGEGGLPRHYAIVEAPNKLENRSDIPALKERESYLCDHNIFPIWFAKGEYQNVENILECLTDEFYQ